MKISTVRFYKDKTEADSQAANFRQTGWPGASVIETDDGGEWIISAHKPHCKCRLCPVLHTNGYFESGD